MTRKIKWNKKELNQGRSSSGVANIQGINGTEKGISQGYTHGSLTKGLVAYYPMERGKGQIIRDAAHNNTGQIKGAQWTEDSPLGNYSLEFDGGDDRVKTLYQHQISFGSLVYWIYIRDTSSESLIGQGTKDDARFYVGVDGNSVQGGFGDSFAERGDSVSEGEWFMVAMVGDGSTATLYHNDEILGQFDYEWNSPGNNFWIADIESHDRNIDGLITDVRVYNRALSQPEIRALYNLTRPNGVLVEEDDVPSKDDGGVSRWGFDDDLDTDTATDSWGDNDGVIEGAVYTSQRVYGDNAMSFDGENDFVEVEHGADSDLNKTDRPFTTSIWVKPEGTGNSTGRLVSRGTESEQSYSVWYDLDDERVRMEVDTVSQGSSGADSVPINEWTHVVVVWTEEGDIIYYINGEEKGERGTNTEQLSQSDTLRIADRPDLDRKFGGIIDDVRIYEKELTPVEVEKLFKKGSHRIDRGDTLQ